MNHLEPKYQVNDQGMIVEEIREPVIEKIIQPDKRSKKEVINNRFLNERLSFTEIEVLPNLRT